MILSMSPLLKKKWISGSGTVHSFDEVSNMVSLHSRGSKIFIGSDSFLTKKRTCFVTAVCLLTKNKGGRYFLYKEYLKTNQFNVLSVRITEEVRRSIELAEYFMNTYSILPQNIELHLDVSPFGTKNGTSKFSEMLRGYVQGYGFGCKLKPNAWASQTVADKHSK
tara:strand:+ start:247 stop:741 length:495 start_codon:yes stop_codon:yes gene_type:complete